MDIGWVDYKGYSMVNGKVDKIVDYPKQFKPNKLLHEKLKNDDNNKDMPKNSIDSIRTFSSQFRSVYGNNLLFFVR